MRIWLPGQGNYRWPAQDIRPVEMLILIILEELWRSDLKKRKLSGYSRKQKRSAMSMKWYGNTTHPNKAFTDVDRSTGHGNLESTLVKRPGTRKYRAEENRCQFDSGQPHAQGCECKKMISLAERCRMTEHLELMYGISERHVCRVIGFARSTHRSSCHATCIEVTEVDRAATWFIGLNATFYNNSIIWVTEYILWLISIFNDCFCIFWECFSQLNLHLGWLAVNSHMHSPIFPNPIDLSNCCEYALNSHWLIQPFFRNTRADH